MSNFQNQSSFEPPVVGINSLRESSQLNCAENPQTITLIHPKIKNWLLFYWSITRPPKEEDINCECGKENKDGINKEGETNVTLGQDYMGETKSKKHQYPWQVMLSSNLSPKVMKKII